MNWSFVNFNCDIRKRVNPSIVLFRWFHISNFHIIEFSYLIYVTNVQWWECNIFEWSRCGFNCSHCCCLCILQTVNDNGIDRCDANEKKKNDPDCFPRLTHIPIQIRPTMQSSFMAKSIKFFHFSMCSVLSDTFQYLGSFAT